MKRLAVLVLLVLTGLFAGAPAASAHPLGNFTVNRYTDLVVAPDGVRIDHVVDLAEVPTLQAQPSIDTDGDGTSSAAEFSSYAAETCARAEIEVRSGGATVALSVQRSAAREVEGQAGLTTLRVECALEGALALPSSGSTDVSLRVEDDGRVGWREVTARGDGATLVDSSVPEESASRRLTEYPSELLSSPLDVRSAEVVARPGGPALEAALDSPLPRTPATDRLGKAFTDLVGDGDVGFGAALVALLLAAGLGALHAMAPGHGKTVMAFYLAGAQATSVRAAATVGVTVTLTHTLGVLLLGGIVSASAAFAPESAYPWLAALSGLVILAVGVNLMRTARNGGHGHSHGHSHPHSHGHGHSHSHSPGHAHPHSPSPPRPASSLVGAGVVSRGGSVSGVAASTGRAGTGLGVPGQPAHGDDHAHADQAHDDHAHDGHTHHDSDDAHAHGDAVATRPRTRTARSGLIAMGLAGGLVPSPSALVVLLGAVAVGRAELGVLLVVTFGLGMAATLTAAGMLVARVSDGFSRVTRAGQHPRLRALTARLPLLTAASVCVLGAVLAVRGITGAL